MTPDLLFRIVNAVALLSWLTLMARPRHPMVLRWCGQLAPLAFAVAYAVLIGFRIGRVQGDFNSLAGVAALFRDPWVLLAGWIHYLVFDLMTGVWEARDAATRNVPQWALVPCLVITFLFGPAGWLLYQGVRTRFPHP